MRGLFIVCCFLAAVNAHEYISYSSSELHHHHKKQMVCYYESSSAAAGYFKLKNHVSAKLCTHIVYSQIGISSTETLEYDNTVDIVDGGFSKLNKLKLNNTGLKTLLLLQTNSKYVPTFSNIIGNITKRDRFARALLNFTKRHQFNGIVIDWEFPSNRGKVQNEKVYFGLFLNALQVRFKPAGLIVAVALSARIRYIESSYSIAALNKHVDLIFLMTTNYHEDWNCITGCETPLFPVPTDWDRKFNVHGSVQTWLDAGINATKLLMAVSMYANTCILRNSSFTGLREEHVGAGPVGPDSNTPGILYYNEVCRTVHNGWTEVMHRFQRVPYAYKGSNWMSYENMDSVEIKARYVQKYKLGGTVVSALHHDDFKNLCGLGHYPLIRTIKKYQNFS